MNGFNEEWAEAYIGLGSNLGVREAQLAKAVGLLSDHPRIRVEACSSVYETDPVGYVEQPAFLNMAVRIITALAPLELLHYLLEAELLLNRKREIHWGPRTIDLDLLLYGAETIQTPELTVPHPRMLERAFVLVPLKDVYSGTGLPGAASIAERLDILNGEAGVRLWKGKL